LKAYRRIRRIRVSRRVERGDKFSGRKVAGEASDSVSDVIERFRRSGWRVRIGRGSWTVRIGRRRREKAVPIRGRLRRFGFGMASLYRTEPEGRTIRVPSRKPSAYPSE
jgi:hypothetical protein